MIEQLTKFRKSLNVSQIKQFFEKINQNDKLNHMKQKVNDQTKILNNIMKISQNKIIWLINRWHNHFNQFVQYHFSN